MSSNKMLSYSGRSYDKTRVVSPYSTKQRFRYYQLQPVKSLKKIPKLYQTLEANLRDKKDSYLLRYAKDITTTTNYHPLQDLLYQSPPRQLFEKAKFERYIGEIKNQDYSKPLQQNCNHRCAWANGLLQTQDSSEHLGDSRLEDLPLNLNNLNVESSKNDQKQSVHYKSKKLDLSDFKSTQPSVVKRRSKQSIIFQETTPKAQRNRGVSFDSSVGHQYLLQVDKRDKLPQFYQIQRSKQSLIRKSMNEPHVHVNFGSFRNSIATRYDRADPNWHLNLDNSNCQITNKDLSYDFKDYSDRKPNQVKSKYAFRQCMNLHTLPKKV